MARFMYGVLHRTFWILGTSIIGYAAIGNQPAAIAQNITIPQQPVEPRLWWKLDRLAKGWIDNVKIDETSKRAIITIDSSRWGALDYVQRFSFLFKLGIEAQKQNFNVILLDRRSQKIAEYIYKLDSWQITPQTLGADPFRVIAPSILQQQF